MYQYFNSLIVSDIHIMPLCTPSCKPPHATNNFYLDLELVNGYNRHIKIPIKNAVFWHAFHPHNSMSHNGSTSTRMISHREKSTGNPSAKGNVRMPSEAPEIHLCHWPALDHMQNLHVAPPRHQSTFHLQLLVVQRAEEASHPLETWALGDVLVHERLRPKWKSKWISSLLGVIFSSFWDRNLQVQQEFMFPFAFAFVKIAEVWIAHEHPI